MINNLVLLQDAAQGSGWSTIIMLVALFAIFYFLMIRPQQKKQKELQKMREAIKDGDKVITAGGIHGSVQKVKESTFLIEISKTVIIEVDKTSVYPAAEAQSQNKA